MRIRLATRPAALFGAMVVVMLLALLPMRAALGWIGAGDDGLVARSASGSVWDGRLIDVRFGGTIASTCPGPAHQVCLDLDPNAVSAWTLEPPSFRVHAWNPRERRLVTHLAASGAFEGPYPFFEDGVLID